MEHELEQIDRTVTKTYEWLRAVADQGNLDSVHRAYQVLRAVLHTLRDRLTPDVAAHVSAQLPMLVRGLFYEGWDPAKTPERMSQSEFLARVEKEAALKGTSEAEDATRAVMAVLWEELGDGTMEHLMSVLPHDFAVFL